MRLCLVVGLLLITGGCTPKKSESALSVTVEELYAHPEKYDGQLISTRGVWVSFFESSTIRPYETRITAKSDGPQDIWLTLDEDSLLNNSPSKLEEFRKYRRKWESTAEMLFFALECEGIFKHKTAVNGFNGYGHSGMCPSEFRVTRLLSSKYIDGISIELLPFTPPPPVWQRHIIADVSQTQTIILKKAPELEPKTDVDTRVKLSDLAITMEGELHGEAELQMLFNGKPLQQARV